MLAGLGTDLDLTPRTRLSFNANHLWFENTAVLQSLAHAGGHPALHRLGSSTAAIWRPKMNQNLASPPAPRLVPGKGSTGSSPPERRQALLFRPLQRDPQLLMRALPNLLSGWSSRRSSARCS